MALTDAGFEKSSIDGLLTSPLGTDSWMMPVAVVASHLGISPTAFGTVDLAGASGCAMIDEAVRRIEAGQCRTVLCVSGASLHGFGEQCDVVQHMAQTGTAHAEFELPYGPSLVSLYALVAQRYLHKRAVEPRDLSALAVAMRANASANPMALRRDPIDIEEVLASPIISSPLRMLDCSSVCDGAAAVIVTCDHEGSGVAVRGYGQALGATYVSERVPGDEEAIRHSGWRAFAASGMTATDIDLRCLYDCFTVALALALEDLGFCKHGEAPELARDGRLEEAGDLTTNPHGGLLSAGHPGLAGGFLHVVEAVERLLNGWRSNQTGKGAPRTALVHGNGGVNGLHGTLILERV